MTPNAMTHEVGNLSPSGSIGYSVRRAAAIASTVEPRPLSWFTSGEGRSELSSRENQRLRTTLEDRWPVSPHATDPALQAVGPPRPICGPTLVGLVGNSDERSARISER